MWGSPGAFWLCLLELEHQLAGGIVGRIFTLETKAKWSGPGHNSVVRAGGRSYIVYHAWSGAHECGDDGARQLMLDPITWKGGWPVVNKGTPSRRIRAAPSVP